MADDLRGRLEAALARHTHNGHLVDAELGDIIEAVAPVFESAVRDALVYDCCGTLRYGSHTMACHRYVGPIDHWKNLGAGGAVSCTCGWPWPAFGEECHNAAETWRGPWPENAT